MFGSGCDCGFSCFGFGGFWCLVEEEGNFGGCFGSFVEDNVAAAVDEEEETGCCTFWVVVAGSKLGNLEGIF